MLQIAARRFLGRKLLGRMRAELISAAMVFQRRFRKVYPKIRARNRKATMQLQKVWRGVKGRRLYKMVRRYGALPDELQSSAIVLQRLVRGHQARALAQERAAEMTAEMMGLVHSVTTVQLIWRYYKRRIIVRTLKRGNRAAASIQRMLRGV